jgi:hypothetical protein
MRRIEGPNQEQFAPSFTVTDVVTLGRPRDLIQLSGELHRSKP